MVFSLLKQYLKACILGNANVFEIPLHQNYKHTKTLEALLGLTENQIHSMIVFVGDCTFKTDMPDNILYAGELICFVKAKREVVLSPIEIDNIIACIESKRYSPTLKTHFNHVNHVKSIINDNRSSKSCPICGHPMILRESMKGSHVGNKFWGCSKYPHCRGTLNVT